MFTKVNPKQSFPKLEEQILKFWQENKIFEASIENRNKAEEFCFFDGPPFATGTPHYGHILAGTIKDVIPRYQTMKGKKVERKFGWDTHGLPIENIVEKKLGISGKEQIEEVGIFKFNEICKENVLTYVNEWRKVVERMGRWVDMDNDYKTMDTNFMESVWWVFKTIYDKGLIYEGNRIVPYCPRCSTPLANFEVNQGYKDKQDKSITVKFKILPDGIKWENKERQDLNKYFLAWTTTPWTLMSNLGLAVGEDVEYSEIKDLKTGEIYILATERLKDYYKSEEEYEVLATYKGTRLEGMRYEPIYKDFYEQLPHPNPIPYQGEGKNQNSPSTLTRGKGQGDRGIRASDLYLGENAYSVVLGHHVDTSTGTGIVHIAPAYGEDDFIIGKKFDLGFVQHIDGVGKVVNTSKDNGKYVFNYNEEVISELKERKIIVKIATIDHSYPHCRRCNTPLIYRGISAWYVAVEKFRDQMVANNEKITWVPETIKYGRFGNWLKEARDWNISRNRYWGSAIPVWQSEDKKEEICVGSIEELYELNKDFGQIEKRNGKYIYTKQNIEVDLHKHFVDEILLKSPKTGNTLKRVPEVLDCWFESGSMPYASKHYPFELERMSEDSSNLSSDNLLKKSSDILSFEPADFIAEGLDQTRGWFYTLLILSTALFNDTSFSNVIVNGTVLAEDGKKMSKSLQNYPDPQKIFDNYGADAMRFYLMNSPVVEAQDFRFAESGVDEVVKKVILPLWNTYYFFVTYANIDGFEGLPDDNKQMISDDSALHKTKIQIVDDEKTRKIIGLGMKVHNELGNGLEEKVYKKAFRIVLKKNGFKVDEEVKKPILFEGEEVGYGKIYLLVDNEIIIELKSQKNTKPDYYKQLRKYLQQSDYKTGLLINFYNNKLQFNRFDKDYKISSEIIGKTSSDNHPSNNLDKRLISELNELIKEVSSGFDSYKLDETTKPIIKFMDNLTNWYIRRSRKRFWKSENDIDKQQAYKTLYFVLVELTKVIAPLIPFISEYIFKELTGKKSVHLENFPIYNPNLINQKLNADTDKAQKIISLGLAWRANNKIRVRQPLNSITITEELDNYYKEIIKEELNVKEILVVSGDKLAKKICKPNGRNIGPKFGKNVKFIMEEAKAGNFEELSNGNIRILAESGKLKAESNNLCHSEFLSPSMRGMSEGQGELIESFRKQSPNNEKTLKGIQGDKKFFELEADDFEIEYLAEDKNTKIESGFGIVIAMDSTITENLRLEGYARDIVRHIQEARKEAGYEVDDRIEVRISEDKSEKSQKVLDKILEKFRDYVENETLSKIVDKLGNVDLEKEIEIEEMKVKIRLKK